MNDFNGIGGSNVCADVCYDDCEFENDGDIDVIDIEGIELDIKFYGRLEGVSLFE